MSDIEEMIRATSALANNCDSKIRAFSDGKLKEYVLLAFRDVNAMMIERGVTQSRFRTEMTITGGATGVQVTPTLPDNFVAPIAVWEQPASATAPWRPVALVDDHLPENAIASDALTWYDWRQDKLWFIAANQDILVRIDYHGGLCDFTMPRDYTCWLGMVNPISYFAAALAVEPTDKALAGSLRQQGAEAIGRVINADIHLRQQRPARRKRFRPGLPEWR